MKAVIFRGIGIRLETVVILTETMASYLKTVCIDTLILAENNIVEVEPNALSSFQYAHCFNVIVLSGNRFSLVTNHNYGQLLQLLPQLTYLKIFV